MRSTRKFLQKVQTFFQKKRSSEYEYFSAEPHIFHFSFHKNLTIYYDNIARSFANQTKRKYERYGSQINEFMSSRDANMRNLNNRFIDLNDFPATLKASLFLRDPRDLVVSAYYYHKRGAERWTTHIRDIGNPEMKSPNINFPKRFMKKGESLSECLNRLSFEDGMQMAIEIRYYHFQELEKWLKYSSKYPNLITLTYDEILADDVGSFDRLAHHYGFEDHEREIWISLAEKFSRRNFSTSHIRNPSSGQWEKEFMKSHKDYFQTHYSELISLFDQFQSK